MLFSQDIGVDLGTANTLVFVKGKGIVIREPSVVAVDERTNPKTVVAVGADAKRMIGRTPGSITAVRPLKDGVIADFDMTSDMLKAFIKRAISGSPFNRARVMICIPSGVTEVERRAVHDAAKSAGARYVSLIEEPMAAAIGAGLPVLDATGSMIVDIGGGTTDIAVISLGGIVVSESIKVAGDKFDEAIIKYIRKKHNILIGERTAEQLKINIGCVFERTEEDKKVRAESTEIRGRSLVSGLPKTITITADEMFEAFEEPSLQIVDAVKAVLEQTPPELVGDISEKGIVMTGGGSLIWGLDRLIAHETGIHCEVAENPISCVAIGTGKSLDMLDVLMESKTKNKYKIQ